jgi:curved DNA-binding protein
MSDTGHFINYYSILQVNPGCDAKMLENAYRYFAKMYHPDHPETANVDRFSQVVEAYGVLRDPEQRAEYDLLYAANVHDEWHTFAPHSELPADDKPALDDAETHAKILTYLYRARRERAQDAGVAGFFIQEMLGCSDEHFEFHRWYLKAKGYIGITEQGTLEITVEGVDHVIAMSRSKVQEQLLIGRLDKASEED